MSLRCVAWTLLVAGCSSNEPQPPADAAVETSAADTTAIDSFEASAPERVYGVTVYDVAPLAEIVDSLSKLPHKPTARIVFDEGEPPSNYSEATTQIGAVAFVMGEVLDSMFVKDISIDGYTARTKEYLDALGGKVDIWEVGNEINGEWLGASSDVAAKAKSAFDLAKGRGYKTALTLYWNASCYSEADHEMFTWTSANIPTAMKNGLDYVLVSYYDDDCPGEKPDWPSVFAKLAAMFPTAKLGTGECGTERAEAKIEFIDRYYGLSVLEPRFIGGQFWWYFVGDMVPSSKPLWSELAAAMK